LIHIPKECIQIAVVIKVSQPSLNQTWLDV
jgi:hypothetical protein